MKRVCILATAMLVVLVACKSPTPQVTSTPIPNQTTLPAVPSTPPSTSPTSKPAPTSTFPLATSAPTATPWPNHWEPVGGPWGGLIRTITINPADPNILYAAGAGGAVYQSSNGGQTWMPQKRLTALNCLFTSILIDATDPNTLYATNECSGIFRSNDAGINWTAANNDIEGNLVLLTNSTYAPGVLLAANQQNAVYRSTNGAGTWEFIGEGLPQETIRGLAISGPDSYWATTTNGYDGTLYRFDGEIWYEVIFPQPTGTETTNVFVSPSDPSTIYIGLEKIDGTDLDVVALYSIDGGSNWMPLQPGDQSIGSRITILGQAQNAGKLYASGAGSLFSTDVGNFWNRIDLPTDLIANNAIDRIAIHPLDENQLYLPHPQAGVIKSQDSGYTWQKSGQGLNNTHVPAISTHPIASGTLYAITSDDTGIFRSDDYGENWIQLNSSPLAQLEAFVTDPSNPNTLYQTSQSGQFFQSSDAGNNWQAVWPTFRASSIAALTTTADPNVIYAYKNGAGLFRSDDGGQLWQLLRAPTSTDTHTLAVHPDNPHFVFNGGSRSQDGGITWEASLSSPNLSISSIVFDPQIEPWFPSGKRPANPIRLYAASTGPYHSEFVGQLIDRGALWFSNDAGDSWRVFNQHLNFTNIQALAVAPHQAGVAYAAVQGGGVWYTQDGGQTFDPLTNSPTTWPIDIAIDPNNNNVIYLADGLSPRLYRSGDKGGTWETLFDAGQDYAQIEALSIALSDSTILLASVSKNNQGAGAIFRIDTNHASENTSDISGDLPGVAASLAVHRRDPSRLFAVIPTQGVWKSTDNGVSWRQFRSGLPDAAFFQIAVDPIWPETLYLAGGHDLDPTTLQHSGLEPNEMYGVWKSTDDGNTWKKMGGDTLGPIRAIAFHPENQHVMYAAGEHGVFLSPDRGETWTGINGRLSFISTNAIAADGQTLYAGSAGAGLYVGALHPLIYTADWERHSKLAIPVSHIQITLHPSDTQIIYASAYPGGVFKTTNQGVTWSGQNVGLPKFSVLDPSRQGHYALVVAPSAPETLYLGLYGQGVYRSDNGAVTWRPVHGDENQLEGAEVNALLVHPTDADVVLAVTSDGIWQSVNGGRSWTRFDEELPPDLGVQALSLGDDGRLYAGTLGYGVYVREDQAPWQQMPELTTPNLTNTQGIRLYVNPANSNVLYASSSTGLYKSSNAGASWQERNVGGVKGGGIFSLAFHPDDAQILYAGTANGLARSLDGGDTWHAWGSAWPPGHRILNAAFDPSNPQVMYACSHHPTSGSLVMKSSDGGASWSEITVGLEANQYIQQIIPDRNDPNIVYLASPQDGIYKSRDGGATWVSWNEGLWNPTAGSDGNNIIGLSADGKLLYFGSAGSGVWRRPAASTSGE